MAELLTHIVQKAFDDDGTKRLAEECVNAMPWRNAKGLEKLRFITPMPEGMEPVVDAEGRYWASLNALRRYKRPELSVKAPKGETPPKDPPAGDEAMPKHKGGNLWELPNGERMRATKPEVFAHWEKVKEGAAVGAAG